MCSGVHRNTWVGGLRLRRFSLRDIRDSHSLALWPLVGRGIAALEEFPLQKELTDEHTESEEQQQKQEGEHKDCVCNLEKK